MITKKFCLIFLLSVFVLTVATAGDTDQNNVEKALQMLKLNVEKKYNIKIDIFKSDGIHKNRAIFDIGKTSIKLNNSSDFKTIYINLKNDGKVEDILKKQHSLSIS